VTDQSAKTSAFYTPLLGDRIALYDGSAAWKVRTFSEITIPLAGLTASKPYDVFAYDNAGVVTIETLVWTNATTRATALVRQNGILVKTGATTRRYLGTLYINGSGGQSDDTLTKRYVYNEYNQVWRPLLVTDTTDSWTQSSGSAYQQARASAANQVEVMVGNAGLLLDLVVQALVAIAGSNSVAVAIGEDSTTVEMTPFIGGQINGAGTGVQMPVSKYYKRTPAVGYHVYPWLEYANGSTATWHGDNSLTRSAFGITGSARM
jgi:hypothetical protein